MPRKTPPPRKSESVDLRQYTITVEDDEDTAGDLICIRPTHQAGSEAPWLIALYIDAEAVEIRGYRATADGPMLVEQLPDLTTP